MSEAILVRSNRPVDLTPTKDSSNFVTSGGIFDALATAGSSEVYIGSSMPSGDEIIWIDTSSEEFYSIIPIENNMLVKDVTVYVSSSGSDENGNGSEENPYATIGKVLEVLPKNLNSNTVTIKINDGIYAYIDVSNFFGGHIVLNGNQENGVSINGIDVNNTDSLIISNILLTVNGSFNVKNSLIYIESNIAVGGVYNGINLTSASKLITSDGVNIAILDNTTIGFNAIELSEAYVYSINGGSQNVQDGVIADTGSTITFSIVDLIARTLYTTGAGGKITVNSQPTLANY